jgi:hypothetical protein
VKFTLTILNKTETNGTYSDFAELVRQIIELVHFVVSDFELLEFRSTRQHRQDVALVHDRLEQFVEDLDGVVLDVKVRRGATEIRRVEVSGALIESDHFGSVEFPRAATTINFI